jgi:DNA end-binding protein Ku
MAKKRRKSSRSWRASWKGEMRLGLVRFTVEAVNAHSRSGSDVHFNQLHDECHSRIEHRKVCPIHGEVDNEEIVLGYEYGRDKYVEIDPDEIDDLRTKGERALTITEVIPSDELDPIYYDGRMYYLSPSEANDREPYHLFVRALEDDGSIAIGQVVFSGKEQLAAIRPRDGVMVMAMLNYAAEIRDPHDMGVGAEGARASAAHLRMAKQLLGSLESEHFRAGDYEDRYRARVKKLLAAKRKGKEIVAPPEDNEEPMIDFMAALRKSVSQSKNKKPAKRRTGRRKAV